MTAARLWNVQIWHPGPPGDSAADAEAYWAGGEGGRLAALYGDLLGMRRVHVGYTMLVHDDGHLPAIGFEDGPEDRRARWPDPEHPQQVHLDIEVGDLDAAEEVALGHGATPLADGGDHRILADPVGHPFCLYPDAALAEGPEGPLPGRLARVVVDCFSPRALAGFYEDLLDLRARVVDRPERVVLADAAASTPMLAFQQAVVPAPRWPDPDHPAQIHLDVAVHDRAAARAAIERAGGILLREGPHHAVYADPAGHPFCVGTPAEEG